MGVVPIGRESEFPFSVPAIASLASSEVTFSSPVTFLVGENGSGKSTLLEGLASAAGSITVGSAPAERDPTFEAGRALGRALKLQWTKRTHRGFFMRAEDFFGYAKWMDHIARELAEDLRAVRDDPALSNAARQFGQVAYANESAAMKRRYGDGLDARSHGEAFLTLFQSRFAPNGLYLLDEPEAPLSPTRQLSLIAMLKMMVTEGNAQFIIATHSPILMAFPGATIYVFEHGRIEPAAYDQVEHVAVTKQFLDDPEAFLRHL
jgi:predicted ATPase